MNLSGIMNPLLISFLVAELYRVLAFGIIGDYPHMWVYAFRAIGWAFLLERMTAREKS